MTVLKDRSGATVGSNEYSGEMSVGFDYTGLQPDNETITYRWPHPPPASFAFRLNFDTLEHLMFFQVEYAEQITDIQGQKGHAFELIFDSLPYLQENDTMIVPSKVYPANLSTDAFVSVFHSGPYTEFGEKWDFDLTPKLGESKRVLTLQKGTTHGRTDWTSGRRPEGSYRSSYVSQI